MPTASEALADFAARLRWRDLPADGAATPQHHPPDVIGVATTSPAVPCAHSALRADDDAGSRTAGLWRAGG